MFPDIEGFMTKSLRSQSRKAFGSEFATDENVTPDVYQLTRDFFVTGTEGCSVKTVTLARIDARGLDSLSLLHRLQGAINDDLRDLNAKRDFDVELLHRYQLGEIEAEDVRFTSIFMDEAISEIDTVYRLRTPRDNSCILFAMENTLKENLSEQIEIQTRRALRTIKTGSYSAFSL